MIDVQLILLFQSGEINVDHSVEELIDRVLMVKETGELPQSTAKTTTKPVNGEKPPKPPKAKKAKQSPPPKQPFQLTPAQAMQLEIYYHNTAVMPGPKMLKAWSAEMNINAKDVKTWFQVWSLNQFYSVSFLLSVKESVCLNHMKHQRLKDVFR